MGGKSRADWARQPAGGGQRRAGGEARRARRSGGGREGAAGAVLSAAIFVGRVFSRRGGSDCWEGLEMMGPGRNHPAGGREGGAPRWARTIGGRGGSALEAPWAWAGSVGAAPAKAGPRAWAAARGRQDSGGRIPGWRRDVAACGIWRRRAFSAGLGESGPRGPACLGRARAFAGLHEPPLWAVPQGITPAARLKRRVVSAPCVCKHCLHTVPHCRGLKSILVSFLNGLHESAIEKGIR